MPIPFVSLSMARNDLASKLKPQIVSLLVCSMARAFRYLFCQVSLVVCAYMIMQGKLFLRDKIRQKAKAPKSEKAFFA